MQLEPKILVNFLFSWLLHIFRINIPNVYEGHPRYSVGRTLSTNLVFTIWAVFGGFILHFLLSNYLTVLLRPNFEKPVDTAADLIRSNLVPVVQKNQKIYRQIFANSPDPDYQELSLRLCVAEDFNKKVKSIYNTSECLTVTLTMIPFFRIILIIFILHCKATMPN